jgi:PAS domain S-box-containing protein
VLVDYRIRQREYLLAIGRALTSELDLGDVLRIIVQASVEFISGRAGIIALADPHAHVFRIAAAYGIPRQVLESSQPLLAGLPYEEGNERATVPRLTRLVDELVRDADLGLSRVVRLPMLVGDTIVGVIYVFLLGQHVLSPDAPELLQSFADQAAIAVKNARLYQEVIAEKQRLDAILEHSADGVMILDNQLHVTGFNTSLSQMTGWPANDAVGRRHDEIVRWVELRTSADLEAAQRNGWPLPGAAHLYVEGDLARRDGDVIRLGITYAPVLDVREQLVNIVANARDLTRFKEEEELQKTFISVVSHELKTPVSIIKGYAGTLQRQEANWPADVQQEYLAVIEEEADNLTDLIDNLLEASKLQSGTFRLDASAEVFLPDIAEAVARKLGGQTDIHEIVLAFSPDFPVILGDERRLTQVLNNLVSNAIKYSPQGGKILISGTVQPGHVSVAVRDEGIGIPAHQQHRIFQKFSRLDNALSRQTEGTGLGLFLTRAIVEAHGGNIWFLRNDEEEPGCPGTTFAFSLPIK